MPLKVQSILKCLQYPDCSIDTLLYLVCLDGVDPKSIKEWDNQYEDLGELVLKTFQETVSNGEADDGELSRTLASALLRIGEAIHKAEAKKRTPKKSTKSATQTGE